MTKNIIENKIFEVKLIILFLSRPIGLHREGGVYELYWDQPPGGDQDAMASLLMISAAHMLLTSSE